MHDLYHQLGHSNMWKIQYANIKPFTSLNKQFITKHGSIQKLGAQINNEAWYLLVSSQICRSSKRMDGPASPQTAY